MSEKAQAVVSPARHIKDPSHIASNDPFLLQANIGPGSYWSNPAIVAHGKQGLGQRPATPHSTQSSSVGEIVRC